jgi:hypothetical protein
MRRREYRAKGAQRMSRERRIDDCDAGLAHIIMVPASIGTSTARTRLDHRMGKQRYGTRIPGRSHELLRA